MLTSHSLAFHHFQDKVYILHPGLPAPSPSLPHLYFWPHLSLLSSLLAQWYLLTGCPWITAEPWYIYLFFHQTLECTLLSAQSINPPNHFAHHILQEPAGTFLYWGTPDPPVAGQPQYVVQSQWSSPCTVSIFLFVFPAPFLRLSILRKGTRSYISFNLTF